MGLRHTPKHENRASVPRQVSRSADAVGATICQSNAGLALAKPCKTMQNRASFSTIMFILC
jgi:hypothetical protein